MSVSLHDAIQSHIRDFENQLYTSCPAIVDSYDPSDCTVDVYPAIYKSDKDGVTLQEAFLSKVPLHFQATKELGVTFPVRKGDTVLLIFGHSDAERWLSGNKDFEYPNTRRKHNMNDAYAIAGVFRYGMSPVQTGTEEDLNIRYNGSYVRLKANGDIVIDTSSGQNATFSQGGDVTVNASSNITATAGTKVIVNAPTVEINSATKIDMTAPVVNIDADEINFGGIGGQAIARVGDSVEITYGSSAGTHFITSGSSIGKIN